MLTLLIISLLLSIVAIATSLSARQMIDNWEQSLRNELRSQETRLNSLVEAMKLITKQLEETSKKPKRTRKPKTEDNAEHYHVHSNEQLP